MKVPTHPELGSSPSSSSIPPSHGLEVLPLLGFRLDPILSFFTLRHVYWLVLTDNLTTYNYLRGGILIEDLPRSDWPVNMSMGGGGGLLIVN